MNDQAPARAGFWLWDNLPQLAAAVLLLGALGGTLTFLFGGFRPQSQVDLQAVQENVTSLKSDLASVKQAAASDRAAALTAVEAVKQLFYTELKAWPLPRELSAQASAWNSDLSKLQGRADGLEHRINDAEYNIRDLTNKYGALTSTARK